ncbi:MAG: sigma-70 family RNA polymerase sigma factor [Myxococcales bacterium]|nr:sigma-70 family RNA polymerase sigma factor [Myxococcales bacterium]
MTPERARELSDALAKGDRAALGQLYAAYSSTLLSVVLRRVRNRAEAEEVVQETFIEAWRRAEQFQPERANIAAWLVTIAKSRAIDKLRGRAVADRAAANEPEAPPPRQPDEVVESVRSRTAVRRVLATLPVEQRSLLELAWDEGLSHTEIAERTGLPLGTVKTRTRTALMTLKDVLREHA